MRRLWLLPAIALVVTVVSVVALRTVGAQEQFRPLRARFSRQGAAQRARLSPHESVTADVDGARLTVVYGRPLMRGRKIFGSLVRYDEVWCPGADEATTLESTRDLQIGSLRVPAGPHTIWMLPTADRWTLVVSKEPSGFHTDYNGAADLGRVDLMKHELPSAVEQLTFAIDRNPAGGGTLAMAWETTEVSVPFIVVR